MSLSFCSQSWYVANCDWGDNPRAVWEWMVQEYKDEPSRRGYGGGGAGGGGGRPRSSDWKAEADAVLKVNISVELVSNTAKS